MPFAPPATRPAYKHNSSLRMPKGICKASVSLLNDMGPHGDSRSSKQGVCHEGSVNEQVGTCRCAH